jgi:hypothetical protein
MKMSVSCWDWFHINVEINGRFLTYANSLLVLLNIVNVGVVVGVSKKHPLFIFKLTLPAWRCDESITAETSAI